MYDWIKSIEEGCIQRQASRACISKAEKDASDGYGKRRIYHVLHASLKWPASPAGRGCALTVEMDLPYLTVLPSIVARVDTGYSVRSCVNAARVDTERYQEARRRQE